MGSECSFKSEEVVLISNSKKYLSVREVEESDALVKAAVSFDSTLEEFQKSIESIVSVDPYNLLLRQYIELDFGADKDNAYIVYSNLAGKVRRINCLESLLYTQQAKRMINAGTDLFTSPAEFMSYVVRKGKLLKVYFYTIDQAGIGNPKDIVSYVKKDIDNGWDLLFNLHNHNFFPFKKPFLGATVPSANDINAYRSESKGMGLRKALVTNGFHTIEVYEEDFYTLKGTRD
ncbi:MAG: hypothetical protein QF441_09445 [Bacteriovoracaceae bacterium]|jgi:hypothetical protein|nr:hypothetical protein [Bacteriovoracaceae bacterium]